MQRERGQSAASGIPLPGTSRAGRYPQAPVRFQQERRAVRRFVPMERIPRLEGVGVCQRRRDGLSRTAQRADRHVESTADGVNERSLWQRRRSLNVVRDASSGVSRVSVWIERVGMRCKASSFNAHRKTDNREVCTLQESDVSRPETIPHAADAKIGLIVY
jgi:hypothetical protein